MEEIIREFFGKYTKQSAKKGTIILHPESHGISTVYYIAEGHVRMYVVSEKGEELTLHIFKKGSFFPMMLVFSTGTNNKYYFEAITDVVYFPAPLRDVLEFLDNTPTAMKDLVKRLSSGIVGYLLKVENLLLRDAYTKVVSLLVHLADKYGKDSPEGIAIDFTITHNMLSTWLGITRETVSRQIEKLEKEGLLVRKGHAIIITNEDKLLAQLENLQE